MTHLPCHLSLGMIFLSRRHATNNKSRNIKTMTAWQHNNNTQQTKVKNVADSQLCIRSTATPRLPCPVTSEHKQEHYLPYYLEL